LFTGRYGTNEQIQHVLKDLTQVQHIQNDVDLSGVPCRWIRMRNGAMYQTYDLDFPPGPTF
jgi:hypothetical protein